MNAETDDLVEAVRAEMDRVGIPTPPKPEDFGLRFRSVSSFVDPGEQNSVVRRIPRWLPPIGAAVAAGVLAFAVVASPGDTTAPTAPEDSAASSEDAIHGGSDLVSVSQVVARAATASRLSTDLSAGRYLRIEVLQKQGAAPQERRTSWLGRRAAGLLIDDFGRTALPPATFGLQRTSLTWDELVSLPPDPEKLSRLLEREARGLPDSGYYVVKIATELLTQSPAPPALRGALWQVIAAEPGVRSTGTTLDALGRAGVGLVYQATGRARIAFVVDASAGTVLQVTRSPVRAGADSFQQIFLDARMVDRLPAP